VKVLPTFPIGFFRKESQCIERSATYYSTTTNTLYNRKGSGGAVEEEFSHSITSQTPKLALALAPRTQELSAPLCLSQKLQQI